MEIFLFISMIFSVVIFSALASGSEAAILSVSYPKVKDLVSSSKNKRTQRKAKHVILIKENLREYISTIVVLNNIVNIVGSLYVGVLAGKIFGEFYLGIISGILTFLIIMFSEIIPKVYGEKHSLNISLKIAGVLILLTKIFKPINYILNHISSFFIKGEVSKKVSEGEIVELANIGKKEGSINSYENDVINNVFRMNDTEVFEIMIPKNEVVTLEKTSSYEEILKIVRNTGFTRFPISEKGEIIGIINVKDLLLFKEEHFNLNKIIRPVIFAPEAMKIITLEEKLKKSRIHLAIIVNEFGDFTGIVTLEDIIEELLGDIEDEFDKNKELLIEKISENKYHIKGNCDIDTINKELMLQLSNDEDYTTLNGFLISKLDKIPRVNDKFILEGLGVFRVINSSKRKVLKVEFLFNRH